MENNGRSYKAWDTKERGEITVNYYKNGGVTIKPAGSLFAGHNATPEEIKGVDMNNPRYTHWKFAGYIL